MTENTTEIVKPEGGALAPPPSFMPTSDQRQQIEAASTPFIPGIKLLQGISTELEDKRNKAGEFMLQGDNLNLGEKLIIGVYNKRDHALILHGKTRHKESFDWNSPVFQQIKNTKQDRAQQISVFWGLDLLVWLPDKGRFATFFFGRTSQRACSLAIVDSMTPMEYRKTELAKSGLLTNVFELYSHFETKKFGPNNRCHVPMVTPLPMDHAGYKPPRVEDLDESTRLFLTPVLMEKNQNIVEVDETEER